MKTPQNKRLSNKKWLERNPNYMKEWRRKNKAKIRRSNQKWHQVDKEIMHELKINGCAICGYNKCDGALEFHHVNPEDKKFDLSTRNLPRYSSKFFVEELNKCILFCSNCHRETHWG